MMFNTEVLEAMLLKSQLKNLISHRGVTVTSLSKATKVPKQTIHSWMTGAKPRDFDQVKRVADYFNVTLDFLAYGIRNEISQSTEIEKHRDEINAGIFEVILRRTSKGGK